MKPRKLVVIPASPKSLTNQAVKPEGVCWICQCVDWYWRPANNWGPGEWLCNQCHPDPKELAKEWEQEHGKGE